MEVDDDDDDGFRPSAVGTAEQIEDLVRGGYFDGMVRRLAAQFPRLPWHDVEDAVEAAVVKVLKVAAESKAIDEPRGYLYAIATNELRRRSREGPLAEYDAATHGGTDGSAEEKILVRELFRLIKRLVDEWESERLRTITLLYLESAYEGVRLPLSEAAHIASQILGEDVPANSIGKTKERGLRRLAEQLAELDQENMRIPESRRG